MTKNTNLIKVVNPIKAEELHLMGFSYMLEKNGEMTLYVFIPTKELVSYIGKNFERKDYVYEERLKF